MRYGKRGLILALITIAIVQVTIAGFTILGKEIPIPRTLAHAAFNRLLDPAWQLDLYSAKIDLLGGIRAEQVVLRSRAEGYRILEIEQLWADLDLWEWAFKTGPGLDRLAISNATLLAPGHMSASGLENRLLQELDLFLEMGSGWLDLKHLQSRVDGHPVVIISRDPLQLPAADSPRESLDLVALWSQWVPIVIAWKETLPACQGLLIQAQLEALESGFAQARLTVFASQVQQPQTGLVAETLELEFPRFVFGRRAFMGSGWLRAKSLRRLDSDWLLKNPQLHIPHFRYQTGEQALLEIHQLHVYSSGLETPWDDILGISLSTGFNSFNNTLQGQAGVRHDAGTANVDFDLQREGGAGLVHLRSPSLDIMSILTKYLKPEWMEHIPVARQPISLAGTLFLNAYLEPERLEWQAHVKQLQIDNVILPYARAEAISTLSTTDIFNAEAWMGGGQYAKLSYLQEYPRPGFRLTAEGHSLQSNLDPILDFPWWWQIWEEVSSEDQVVEADVRVEGVWGEKHTTRSWVGIDARNVAFRDLPLKRMYLSLAQSAGKVDIYRMFGETANGAFAGSLHWRIPDNTPEMADNLFHVHGSASLGDIRRALGNEGHAWLDEFSSEASPQLEILMSRKRHRQAGEIITKDRYLIDILADQPTVAYGFPLDHLRVRAELTESMLTLRHTHLLTLGGEAWLELDLGSTLDDFSTPPYRISLAARNLDHNATTSILRKRFAKDIPDPETTPAKEGKMDADLKMSGYVDQIETYRGSGTLMIYQADLGQVRIFGELSGLFDSVGLPFTSLDLEKIQATWQLQDGKILISDAHISGPSIRLNADGSIRIPGSELDFTVQAFVIRGLFGLVFRPVNMVFEFRLGGELADPQWSFRINPFRWLTPN